MSTYTHLFFDLDHTLWDTDANAEESLRELFTELKLEERGVPGFDAFHDAYHRHNDRLWGLYAENKVGKEAVRNHRFQLTLQDFGIYDNSAAVMMADEFVRRTPHRKALIPGAIELLDVLKGRFNLSIITNGFREAQHIKMSASGLEPYFRHIFISEEVGCMKPDTRIFRHAMEASGAESPDHCMMIGDTYQTDVFGALQSGMLPVHLNSGDEPPHPSPVITIGSLHELKTVLGLG